METDEKSESDGMFSFLFSCGCLVGFEFDLYKSSIILLYLVGRLVLGKYRRVQHELQYRGQRA